MDTPPKQQDARMNITRTMEALAPYLHHPRQTVILIECLIAWAILLLFMQLLFGSRRRRLDHWFLQGFLWVVYTGSFPLMTYTFSQMVTSPVKNVLYPLWAVLLLWVAGCANSMTVYSLEDNKQWKRFVFDIFQYFGYMFIIALLLDPRTPRRLSSFAQIRPSKMLFPQPIEMLILLRAFVVCFTNNLFRIAAAWNVTSSTRSKLVADYMRVQVETRGQEEPLLLDPVTMKGYTYLVWFRSDDTRLRRGVRDGVTISIDEIWDMTSDDGLRSATRDGWQLKHACLSLALSHLLCRRFFGMDCVEAGHPETLRFALEGLLAEEDDEADHYSTVFGIIEVELGFLYDFFTKYAPLFAREKIYLASLLLKVVCAFICGILMVLYSPSIKTPNPIIEVGTRWVDVTTTVLIMAALLIFEALQVILYLTSDWATVSLVCNLILNSSKHTKFFILASKKIFGSWIDSFGYWQNKMGQSSVIECCELANSCLFNPMKLSKMLQELPIPIFLSHPMAFWNKTFQVVPGLVRTEIISCLQKYSNGGPLTNGEAALHLNGVHAEFPWALQNNSQAVAMVIWHIATEYCSIASSHVESAAHHQSGARQQERVKLDNYQQVATTLSKYCAYLMFFIPELLPGNSTDTAFILNDVILEGSTLLGKDKPTRNNLLKVITDFEDDDNNNNSEDRSREESIFVKGLKLGRDLEKEDAIIRWKVLAELWAETIIYIAPSDNAVAHMERRAEGGEFLTHIWALLTHAGILKRG